MPLNVIANLYHYQLLFTSSSQFFCLNLLNTTALHFFLPILLPQLPHPNTCSKQLPFTFSSQFFCLNFHTQIPAQYNCPSLLPPILLPQLRHPNTCSIQLLFTSSSQFFCLNFLTQIPAQYNCPSLLPPNSSASTFSPKYLLNTTALHFFLPILLPQLSRPNTCSIQLLFTSSFQFFCLNFHTQIPAQYNCPLLLPPNSSASTSSPKYLLNTTALHFFLQFFCLNFLTQIPAQYNCPSLLPPNSSASTFSPKYLLNTTALHFFLPILLPQLSRPNTCSIQLLFTSSFQFFCLNFLTQIPAQYNCPLLLPPNSSASTSSPKYLLNTTALHFFLQFFCLNFLTQIPAQYNCPSLLPTNSSASTSSPKYLLNTTALHFFLPILLPQFPHPNTCSIQLPFTSSSQFFCLNFLTPAHFLIDTSSEAIQHFSPLSPFLQFLHPRLPRTLKSKKAI